MDSKPNNFQRNPLKLYIQDIFRAQRSESNRYIYELFGQSFKNVMINGVVMSIYNNTGTTVNIELSDPTGTVQVYYDCTKNNHYIPTQTLKNLHRDFAQKLQCGDEHFDIKLKMLDALSEKKQKPLDFEEGSYLNIVGDIFVDDRQCRMISAYECKVTSIERDIVWMEELKYLYDKFYLLDKE